MGSPIRAACRLLAYFAWTLALIPLQIVLVVVGARAAKRLPQFYHRTCCRILGIKIETRGRPCREHPVLFVCNHTSYLDISVLGALIEGCFVAKSEVARWPLFGILAKLQRTVFVDRSARAAKGQRDEIAARLAAGDDLILFPEGTSSDGNRILPFKSALFAVAERPEGLPPLVVQPVSIAFTRLDGMPIGRNLRPYYAWYGDMDMASHMWGVAALGTVTVEVEFHPTATLAAFGSRKALALHCRNLVAGGLSAALSGRRQFAANPQVAAPGT